MASKKNRKDTTPQNVEASDLTNERWRKQKTDALRLWEELVQWMHKYCVEYNSASGKKLLKFKRTNEQQRGEHQFDVTLNRCTIHVTFDSFPFMIHYIPSGTTSSADVKPRYVKILNKMNEDTNKRLQGYFCLVVDTENPFLVHWGNRISVEQAGKRLIEFLFPPKEVVR